MIDKYRQPSHVQRASLMSATLAGIRLRALRISAENFAAIQTLTTALVLSADAAAAARRTAPTARAEVCDRRLLWRFGISGDRPIVLVSAGVLQGLGLLRSLAQALRLWSWGGVACDLVVVNAEPASYLMALQRELAALRERHAADSAAQRGAASTGLHVLRADELSADELSTLQRPGARAPAGRRPPAAAPCAGLGGAARAGASSSATTSSTTALAAGAGTPPAGAGAAGRASRRRTGEFRFDVGAALRPARPWINVLANPGFGAQMSEAGGGYTWAVNSRLNQLTAWSNDPVADPPSEWFLLQDRRTLQVWSVAPSRLGRPTRSATTASRTARATASSATAAAIWR